MVRQAPEGRTGLITSRHNPRYKFLRSLRQRKYRRREGRFLAEGIRFVEEALDREAGPPIVLDVEEMLMPAALPRSSVPVTSVPM